jgi:hypothetical protein
MWNVRAATMAVLLITSADKVLIQAANDMRRIEIPAAVGNRNLEGSVGQM